jgi:hypothetical protein
MYKNQNINNFGKIFSIFWEFFQKKENSPKFVCRNYLEIHIK